MFFLHLFIVELDMPEGMNYIRTPELLKRWSEFSAFGFGMYYCYFFYT